MSTSAVAASIETPEQVEVRLRKEIRQELEPIIRIEYEGKYEIWKAKDLADLDEKQTAEIQKALEEHFQKMAEEAKPPSDEEIQKLLNQEYATFDVKLQVNGSTVTVAIRELPQDVEQQFYRMFQKAMTDKASDLAALAQSTMDQPLDKKIQAFLNTFDSAFDLLAQATQLCLNFDNKNSDITCDWCKKNLTSFRMWNIVQAQIKVNRLRDFFSQVSHTGKQIQMTQRPSVQLLQELQRR